MKVEHAQHNVIGSSGLQESASFKIAATGHAFKMLSSGLYSDKVRAVLREIGCNAADAHIEGKCPERPFRVKLPNPLDEQFYVQDWGPGLSHDATMNLYTTYFASTKQTSNEFTGAFGLGSKSPFSYIDSFSVVSTHGGKKRTYSLYLDNSGAPTVSLMSEEEPDVGWESGVRVGFAVKPADFEEFKEKAQDVFQWFKVPPEMRGSPPIQPIAYRSDREEFRLLKEGGDAHILMGNVAYPLDFSKCGVEDPFDNKKGLLLRNYAKCASGFVLVMPMGSVQVAASREHLQYDPASIRALQERLDLSMRKLGNDIVDRLEAALSGGWLELCKVKDLIEQGLPGSLRYDFGTFGRALGLDIAKVSRLKPYISRSQIDLPKEAGVKTACRLVYVKEYGKGRGHPTSVWVEAGHTMGGQAKISVDLDTVIAAGACGYAVPRARKAVRDGTYKQVLVFGKSEAKKATDFDCHEEAQAVSKLLGGVPVIDLQTLPEPPVSKGSAKRRPKGWKPSLPTTEFTTYVMEKKDKRLLGDLPDQLFACLVSKSAWGNMSKHHRLYEKSTKDDASISWDRWEVLWRDYVKLQSKLGLPSSPQSYAVVTGQDVRTIKLTDLGWTNALTAVHEYIKRPEVADELRKRINKRHLVAPDDLSNLRSGEWMSAIACLHGDGELRKDAKDKLAEFGLMGMVDGMAKARGKGQVEVVPPEMSAYSNLTQHFNLPNQLASDIQSAMSVEAVDEAFSKRFPRAEVCDPYMLEEMHAKDKDDLIMYILGRQA